MEMGIALATVCILVVLQALGITLKKLWRAKNYRAYYERQGIRGPPFRFFVGNIPEIQSHHRSVPQAACSFNTPGKLRITPEFCHFFKTYGNISVHELGSATRLVFADSKLAREVLVSRASCYQKADLVRENLRALLGNGVVVSDGDFWKQQRRILNPAFKVAYLKGLTKHMFNAAGHLLGNWKLGVEKHGFHLVDAHREMAGFTLDVISRCSFGESFKEGQMAFECLDKLLSSSLVSMNSYKRLIPGYSWMPTPENMRLWSREKYVKELLKDIIQRRQKINRESQKESGSGPHHDLLHMMLQAMNNGSPTMSMAQLLDECKTIFFAGHSTTALTLTWTLIMLSIHKQWQQRAREEVLNALKNSDVIGVEDLGNLETIGWIINEVLRLFPPLSTLTRQCNQAHTIGEITILPGTVVVLPVLIILQSKELWGEDVYEFNPERFRDKTLKDLPGFISFGSGPRMCLGMNFALLEAKLLLSLLLRDFVFDISPDYIHAPGKPLSSKPAFGSPLIVRKYHPES